MPHEAFKMWRLSSRGASRLRNMTTTKRSSGNRMEETYPWISIKLKPLLMLLVLAFICLSCCLGGKTTTFVRHTDTLDPQADGFWANKTTWNARWVKYWRAKKIYEPVWKKVWTPTVHNEWVPLPNAPNDWELDKGHYSDK